MKATSVLIVAVLLVVAAYVVVDSVGRQTNRPGSGGGATEELGRGGVDDSADAVVSSGDGSDLRRPAPVVEENVDEEAARPALFVGEVMAEDFLRQWWGDDWPTVEAWMREHGHEIPKGPCRMDGQLLPDEAHARVRAVLLANVTGESNETSILAKSQRLEDFCVLPTDTLVRGNNGLVLAPRIGGGSVSLTEAQFEAVVAALAPRRDVLRAAYQAIMDAEARIGVEQVQAGGYHMAPFVEYYPDDCRFVTEGQLMVSDSHGIWRTRMVVDYTRDPYYNALKADYDKAVQDTLKVYDQLVAGY